MPVIYNKKPYPNPREVRLLADKLIEAENALLRLQAEWKVLFSGTLDQEQDQSKATLSDRILSLLNDHEAETFTSVSVSHALSANPNSVGPLLSRLLADGKVRKVGYGEYRAHPQATDWELVHGDEDQDESPVALSS